jgi:hypothetical protein
MEIFGGFMVMMSIISLFLAVVWLIMPFVVFAIKGKQDRSLEILEGLDKRISEIEQILKQHQTIASKTVDCENDVMPAVPAPEN